MVVGVKDFQRFVAKCPVEITFISITTSSLLHVIFMHCISYLAVTLSIFLMTDVSSAISAFLTGLELKR